MDRKGIVAVTLAVIVLMVWSYFNQQETQKAALVREKQIAAEKEQEKSKEKAKAAEAEAKMSTTNPAVLEVQAGSAPATENAATEKLENLSGASVDYTFSNLGGGIAKALLKEHESEKGSRMVLNEFGETPIGAISDIPGEGTRAAFTSTLDAANHTITFSRTDGRRLELVKRFTVSQATSLDRDYLVQMDVSFTNRSAEKIAIPGYYVSAGSSAPIHQRDGAQYTGFKCRGGKFIDVNYFSSGFFSAARPTYTISAERIAWAAVTDQYYASLVQTIPTAGADPALEAPQRGTSGWARRFPISDEAWTAAGRSKEGKTGERFGVEGALGMPALVLDPGKTVEQTFRLYTGPRQLQRLKLLGDGADSIMEFGWSTPVSQVLLDSLNWLHQKIGSYAAAIILLTLIIKTMLWPLQNASTRSMKRMQLLAPKQNEIKEKYKDDPTRMNTEVMKLYRDYKINPLAGCLPLFVQMPLFIGFYNMLGKAVELRNSKFLWVHDLSQPDTVAQLKFAAVNLPINVLPICMALTMLWQMRISPKSGDPAQQKMFMFMPLIFVYFCYNYASALALYWTVQNLFSVAQLYVTRNQAPPTLEKAAPPKRK